MNTVRKTSILVGITFIIATITALAAAALDPLPHGVNTLSVLPSQTGQVYISSVFYILAAVTSAGIAILMYPILQPVNAALALGAVVFRAIEAVFYLIAVLGFVSLVSVDQALGGFLSTLRDRATLLGVISFCIGALMYYGVFIQAHLLPYWLSVWGIVGVFLMLLACGLSLISNSPITGYTVLVFPIALQEMVLAVWLIVRGFRGAALSSKG